MDKLLIEGGYKLNGSVTASGSKNSALPILASSILLRDKLTLSNIPHLNDIPTMFEILSSMGAYMTFNENMDINNPNEVKVVRSKSKISINNSDFSC